MSEELSANHEKVTQPVLQLSVEDKKDLQEAAQSVIAAMPVFARQFAKKMSAFDKQFEETEERIKRGGKRTSGRIQL